MLNFIWILCENQSSNFFCLFFFFFFLKKKQLTFCDCTTGFPGKWRLRNGRRNCILITRHYPDFGSASDWSCRVENFLQPIRSTTQIWIVTRHQYGISAFVSQWWRREMWAVFSGLFCCCFVSFVIFEKRPCFNVQQTFLISERLEEEIITRLEICIRCV